MSAPSDLRELIIRLGGTEDDIIAALTILSSFKAEVMRRQLDSQVADLAEAVERVSRRKAKARERQGRYRDRKASHSVTPEIPEASHSVTPLNGTKRHIASHSVTPLASAESESQLSLLPGFSEKKKTDSRAKTILVTHPDGEIEYWTDKDIDDAFDELWPSYPRREAKKPARDKFKALVKAGVEPYAIRHGVQRYQTATIGKERQFIALMATWLNQERWNDDQEKVERLNQPVNANGAAGAGKSNGRDHG